MLCCIEIRGAFLGNDPQTTRIAEAQANQKREKARINREIEKELKNEKKKREMEHRILLLGCGEAGKSTFIKQMRIIHSGGFSDREKLEIKRAIANNILSAVQGGMCTYVCMAIQTLLENSTTEAWSEQMEDDARIVEALKQNELRGVHPRDLHPEHTPRISRLWKSEALQAAYGRRNKFQLVQCAKYFLDRCETVLEDDYVPNDQDIVQTRVKTTGIVEHDFEISAAGEKPRKLILIDVGGQRSERKKWIHCFSDLKLLLFLTAVSEYDQVLAEDQSTNRMRESLGLFKLLMDYQWFKETSVILFLNKKDVLEEKLPYSPVKDYFPEYNGRENNYDDTIEFFSEKFEEMNEEENRSVFTHATCATDTENIKIVDVVVQNLILEMIMKTTIL